MHYKASAKVMVGGLERKERMILNEVQARIVVRGEEGIYRR